MFLGYPIILWVLLAFFVVAILFALGLLLRSKREPFVANPRQVAPPPRRSEVHREPIYPKRSVSPAAQSRQSSSPHISTSGSRFSGFQGVSQASSRRTDDDDFLTNPLNPLSPLSPLNPIYHQDSPSCISHHSSHDSGSSSSGDSGSSSSYDSGSSSSDSGSSSSSCD